MTGPRTTPSDRGDGSLFSLRALSEQETHQWGPFPWNDADASEPRVEITKAQLDALIDAVVKSYRCYAGDISGEALLSAGEAYDRFDWTEFDA